ncbi:MAG: alpha/beta fold hydrolase [Firmicutes bacterium]|nr:alpha/beta fold hydrolase [Bacillota bacterium]
MNHSRNQPEETSNIGIKGTLPAFSEQLKNRLTFTLSWTSGNFSNFEEWREAARAKVWEHILPLPEHRTPFNPETISQQDRGAFFARKIVFNLTEFSRVPALMLIPKGRGPFPAVLLLHDHGSKFDIGKEKVIEPWDDRLKLESAQAWSKQLYDGSFIGNELAARGYCVLAHDALGWGERGVVSYETQQALACNLLNLGVSLAGLTAYEDVRSAEFLASLPEVDPARVAAAGLSMGAFRAWQVAALSDAVKAGVAVCWMTTLKGVVVPGNNILRGQSAFYMTHPGLARYLDYPDIAGLAAPKPMLFYNGGKDALFPLDSVQEAYRKMRRIWGSGQADDRLETKIWPDLGHEFNLEQQKEAFHWLDHWLKN